MDTIDVISLVLENSKLKNSVESLETQLELKENEIKKLKDQLMKIKEIVI